MGPHDADEEQGERAFDSKPSTPREWENRTKNRAIRIRREIDIKIPSESPAADPRLWLVVLLLGLLIVAAWKFGP
jgi:hypothetical protein